MMPGSAPREQAAWNINAAQSVFISDLVKKATMHYLQGDFDGWYWHLSALRENINHDLTKGFEKSGKTVKATSNERKELDQLEREVAMAKSTLNSLRRSEDIKAKLNARHAYIQKIRNYSRRLGDLLKQLGYLPPKEDRTKLSF